MNREALLIAMQLDQAAAATPQLWWIAPLALIRARALALAHDAVSPGSDLVELCGKATRAVEAGESLPPDALRRILFGLIDAACSMDGLASAEGLREPCARCAEGLRAARQAKPLFQRALREYPEAIRREEEAAFAVALVEMEAFFDQLLRARENAIRAENVRCRVLQARTAHEALAALEGASGQL